MKKCQNILAAIILSVQIILMGVGVPVVQLRCTQCTDMKSLSKFACILSSPQKCTCGCSENGSSCKCAGNGCCTCGTSSDDESTSTDLTEADNTTTDATSEPASSTKKGCSKTSIEKISLPTLTTDIHLDDVVYIYMELPFMCAPVNTAFPLAEKQEYADSSPQPQQCRGYLNLICSLLI